MISARLIHIIEAHQEEITNRILHAVQHHPELARMGKLPEKELRARCRPILKHLGSWLVNGMENELTKGYDALGKAYFKESIPLQEAVRTLCIIKDKMVDFALEQGVRESFLELYAEEELEHRLGRFFDLLIIHLVCGYEAAWHIAARAAV